MHNAECATPTLYTVPGEDGPAGCSDNSDVGIQAYLSILEIKLCDGSVFLLSFVAEPRILDILLFVVKSSTRANVVAVIREEPVLSTRVGDFVYPVPFIFEAFDLTQIPLA